MGGDGKGWVELVGVEKDVVGWRRDESLLVEEEIGKRSTKKVSVCFSGEEHERINEVMC